MVKRLDKIQVICAIVASLAIPVQNGEAETLNWSVDGNLPNGLAGHGAVTVGQDIFVFGGDLGAGVKTDASFLYHPGGGTTVKPTMPGKRNDHGFVNHKGRAYVLGGASAPGGATIRHNDVWSIDPVSDVSWNIEVSMPVNRELLGVARVNDFIYALGGHRQVPNEILDLNQRLDPDVSVAWEDLLEMPIKRNSLGVAAVNGKIYVFGGNNFGVFEVSLDVYDPITNTWASGPDMLTAKNAFATAVVGTRIYAIAGQLTGSILSSDVQYFDVDLGQWFSDTPLPVAVVNSKAAVIDSKIYVLGGLSPNGPVDTVYVTTVPTIVEVEIDIKPGSFPNSINLGSNGVIPVAIFSEVDFDATQIDESTVLLAGAGVAIKGKSSKFLAHEEDVDGDGLLDLVVQVETANLDPGEFQDSFAILAGTTFDGEEFTGTDQIVIVATE